MNDKVQNKTNGKNRIFKAKPSLAGWVSLTVAFGIFMVISWIEYNTKGATIFVEFILYTILTVVVFFAIIYTTMQYEFKPKLLQLKCGPFKWQIPYNTIKEVVISDLKYHPTSTGWKLPGYALFKIYYADRGNIIMCAKSVCKGILLLRTDSTLYGITPKDEDAFVMLLKEKIL